MKSPFAPNSENWVEKFKRMYILIIEFAICHYKLHAQNVLNEWTRHLYGHVNGCNSQHSRNSRTKWMDSTIHFCCFLFPYWKTVDFTWNFNKKNANALYILLNQMKTGLESRERVRKLKKKEQKQGVTCRCRFWAGYFNTNAH